MGHGQKTQDEDDTLLVRNNEAVKPWSNFFRVQIKSTKKNRNFKPRFSYQAKIPIKNEGKIEIFLYIQKLKELINSKPLPQ